MFMDGFHAVLFGGGDTLCLNFYLKSFHLSSALKFIVGLFAVFGLGVSVEAMGSYRRKLDKGARKKGVRDRKNRRVLFAVLHFVQAVMGYVLMLATMTYSVEMLVAACLGLSVGFAIFSDKVRLRLFAQN